MVVVILEGIAGIKRKIFPEEVIDTQRSTYLLDREVRIVSQIVTKIVGMKVGHTVNICKISGK
jgi:hypothetical protein